MDVRITINTDENPQETTWYLKRRKGLPIGSGGPYSQSYSPFSYRYCIDDNQGYEFRILDSGNNGISSMVDAYTITVDGEPYSSSDGQFTSEEVDFVVPPCGPNMDMMQFVLNTGTKPEAVTWKLERENGGQNILNGGPWPDHAGESIGYVIHECLVPTLCYELEVSFADGMSGGSIEVNWQAQNVDTSSSGNTETARFGGGC